MAEFDKRKVMLTMTVMVCLAFMSIMG